MMLMSDSVGSLFLNPIITGQPGIAAHRSYLLPIDSIAAIERIFCNVTAPDVVIFKTIVHKKG